MHDAQSFGVWLKRRREALDLTQADLAQRVGCSTITIRKIESGERRPSKQIAELLAEHFAVPPAERDTFVRFIRGQTANLEAQADAPATWRPAHPTNLTTPLSAFIGREHDLKAAQNELLDPDMRLLTLVGPAGVGKTRLSIALAHAALTHFADGVFFVSLAPIQEPELVTSAIAQTLEIKDLGTYGHAPLEALKQFMRDKRMLLILDNFEQVVRAAPAIAELLSACVRLKVLVTSRERLHLRGEKPFLVSPLTFPHPARPLSDIAGALARYSALALFVERARAARPDFTLTSENAPAVAEICARLDGLPLAIELVAARVKLMSPQMLLARLNSAQGRFRLQLVADGLSDLPVRQQTLYNAIDWSYNLLNAEEQAILRRLAVFVGGCTLEAAEAVLGDGQSLVAAWNGLTSLLDKSLLQQHEQDGETRFTLLETIREYALEKLSPSDEADAVRRRHADYFFALIEQAAPHLTSAEQKVWLAHLERDHANIRAALGWALAHGEADTVARVIVKSLWRFWLVRGHVSEGYRWMTQALAQREIITPPHLAKLWNAAGVFARHQGDYPAAQSFYEESLTLHRQLGVQGGIASVLNNLGQLAQAQGDMERAADLFEESLALWRAVGEPINIGVGLQNLGTHKVYQGDYARAAALLQENLALRKARGDIWGVAIALTSLADAEYQQANWARAQAVYEEALALLRELEDKRIIANTLRSLGDIARQQNEQAQAQVYYREALLLMRDLDDRRELAGCLVGVAALAVMQERETRAVRVLSATQFMLEMIGARLLPPDHAEYERQLSLTRAQLADTAFEQAWNEGRALTLDQLIAYALSAS